MSRFINYFKSRFISYFRNKSKEKIIKEVISDSKVGFMVGAVTTTLRVSLQTVKEDNSIICDICKEKMTSYATGHNGEIICMKCHNIKMENL